MMGSKDYIVRHFALGVASFTIILISNPAWGIGAICVVGEERREIPPDSSLPPIPLVQAYRAPEPRPEGYVEVRTPDGNTCPARVRYVLDGDVMQEWNLPSGSGVVSFSGETERRIERDCSSVNLDYSSGSFWEDGPRTTVSVNSRDCETVLHGKYVAECTRGRYRGFSGGGPHRDSFDTNAPFVMSISDDPDVDEGTIVIEVLLNRDGRHVPSDGLILSPESGQSLRLVSLVIGEGQATLDQGTYDVVVMSRDRSKSGRARINARAGKVDRFIVRVDPIPVTPTPELPEIHSSDFPQVDGRLCNRDNEPVDYAGMLTIRGVDFPFLSSTRVVKGAFTLSGLKRGTYLLRFSTDEFHAERLIDIPLPAFLKGDWVLDEGTFEQRDMPEQLNDFNPHRESSEGSSHEKEIQKRR